MFTTFREKQEVYTAPPPPERSSSGTGYIIFLEDGDILPPYQELFSLTLTWISSNDPDEPTVYPVADIYDINQWNTYFGLNLNNGFESVSVGSPNVSITLKTYNKIKLGNNVISNNHYKLF